MGIEYRAKKHGKTGWVYAPSYSWNRSGGTTLHLKDEDIKVNGFTLGRTTGVRDKNQQPIYSEDVVGCKRFGVCLITWSITSKGLYVYSREADDSYPLKDGADIEVLGNVHDNPGLLDKS